ncbi:hypothetical protein CFN78_18370 [Amycolatopsis antarctica]|uniref:Uncharacterized protein n=1 Tax=Amycolatopsis antarctica TaxID=1854586 RepID=A0A263D029_9PSEU|nr:hypothetical protein [Amycolatopsis antarctica]OZM71794.1 hypothetical protein CFN78_18370 [Amycolatopsis antarctica]
MSPTASARLNREVYGAVADDLGVAAQLWAALGAPLAIGALLVATGLVCSAHRRRAGTAR